MNTLGLLLPLSAILAVTVYSDLRRHRISNKLSVLGLLAGLALQSFGGGVHGLVLGLLGAGVGFGCFAPFYLLRGMGAGDVKLLAAVGAFMGPQGAFAAALCSLLAGGAGAIGYVAWRVVGASIGTLVKDGLATVGVSASIAARTARCDRLPFALPIAVGSIAACWYEIESSGVGAWVRTWHS
jgi:prepilin peptidase CpaA